MVRAAQHKSIANDEHTIDTSTQFVTCITANKQINERKKKRNRAGPFCYFSAVCMCIYSGPEHDQFYINNANRDETLIRAVH